MDKFIENGNFIRIIEEFPPNVADHNRARTEWIGSGKTFKQINKPNSRYRNNINRTDYQGNNSSILQDLKVLIDLQLKLIVKSSFSSSVLLGFSALNNLSYNLTSALRALLTETQ